MVPEWKLNRWAHVRLNEAEEKALDELRGWSRSPTRSALLRKMIREAIDQGPDLIKDDLNAVREAARQLSAIGRNLNQIARAVNSGRGAGLALDSAVLQSVAEQVKTLESKMAELVKRSRQRWVVHDG